MTRTVVWFSCGAPSAVAAKLTLSRGPAVIARIVIPSEHEDNERFSADVERWIGCGLTRLCSNRYADTWDVWERRRFISGPQGALCTTELKKMVRQDFQEPDDIQVFGYTVEERDRADLFRENNPDIMLATPLIDAGLTKEDCWALIVRAGIEIPILYRLGFRNNNCMPCAKATSPVYWNRVRQHFPERFDRMAQLSRLLKVRMTRMAGERVFLDELPDVVPAGVEPDIECSLMCAIAEQEMAESAA